MRLLLAMANDLGRHVRWIGGTCLISLLFFVLMSSTVQAQRWGRFGNQNQGSYYQYPAESREVTARYNQSDIEPVPAIANSSKNTLIDNFADFDVFEPQTSGTLVPFGGNMASGEIVSASVREVVNGISERNLNSRYNVWRGYIDSILKNTRAVRTGSEINGLGRLKWYEAIMADPLRGAAEADLFTKELHFDLCAGYEGFQRAVGLAAMRLDLDWKSEPLAVGKRPLSRLESALENAAQLHGIAIAPVPKADLDYFTKYAHSIFTIQASVGHTVSNRGTARQMLVAMEKVDRAAMFQGLLELSCLMDPEFIRAMDEISDVGASETFEGVEGTIVKTFETSAGLIVIGGRGKNVYNLEKMKNVCCVIDLGGDDVYYEGVCNLSRPILGILDLHGDDTYKGVLPGIQGSSFMGISMLVDAQGNDVYDAKNHAQASTIGGACALIDYDGNDVYHGVRRVQGTALVGLGILLDRRGADRYHAAMWSQGMGQPFGFGVLEDCVGDDFYYSGGMYFDSYPETPGYEGWGQGLGTGIRGVAAGGIGALLDGQGDDGYEYDYIAHGGGYWMGLGFLRDFQGDDRHEGGTTKMWDGSARRERKFQRFSCGFGCHYAAGFFFEDSGNDTFWSSIMSEGFAWDCGAAFAYDFSGNDIITAVGAGNQGQGAQASLGVYVDFNGDDTYKAASQGYASPSIDYHQLPGCGGNFSFLIDYGGTDVYGCKAKNNAITKRGTSGGFLVDRPAQSNSVQE